MGSDLLTAVVAEAQSWLGVPYMHDGQDREGVDCANWIGVILLNCGIISHIPQIQTPKHFWTNPDFSIESSIETVLGFVQPPFALVPHPVDDLEPGMFLGVTQFRRLRKITHMVLVETVAPHAVGIIHAQIGEGVQRSRLSDAYTRLTAFRAARLG